MYFKYETKEQEGKNIVIGWAFTGDKKSIGSIPLLPPKKSITDEYGNFRYEMIDNKIIEINTTPSICQLNEIVRRKRESLYSTESDAFFFKYQRSLTEEDRQRWLSKVKEIKDDNPYKINP